MGFLLKSRGRQAADQQQKTCVGVSPSWLRHRILIPAFAGSNPSTPAKFIWPLQRTLTPCPGKDLLFSVFDKRFFEFAGQ
jgi:hypothetical protein